MYSKSRNTLSDQDLLAAHLGRWEGFQKKNTPSQLLGGPQNWMDMLWVRIGHPMNPDMFFTFKSRSQQGNRFKVNGCCHGTWRGNSKLCERADLLPFFGLFFLRWLAKPWLRDRTHWQFHWV